LRAWIRHMMNNAAAEKDFTVWLENAIQKCLLEMQKVLIEGDAQKAMGLAFETLVYQNLQQTFRVTKNAEMQRLEKMEE
jgi:hypothetical protein